MKYFLIFLILISFSVIAFAEPVPEPEPQGNSTAYENCEPGTTLQDGICIVEESQKRTTDSSGKWGAITFPPALQLSEDNSTVPLFDNFFSITEKQVRYDMFYDITNATIKDVQLNCDSASFALSIISNDDGILQLDIPKDMLGGIFMVLVDGKEWDDVSLEGNVLTVNFTKDATTIEVLGTYNLSTNDNDGVCDVVHDPPYSYILSPLKQIQSGTALFDVKCSEEKYLVYKYDRMRAACVDSETETELINRGWALMRLGFPEYTRADISSSLCGNYGGKWHQEYEGCRGNITDLQCSLMDGTFVDGLEICYDGICPVDKTYTLCVTNPDLISGEKENEN